MLFMCRILGMDTVNAIIRLDIMLALHYTTLSDEPFFLALNGSIILADLLEIIAIVVPCVIGHL